MKQFVVGMRIKIPSSEAFPTEILRVIEVTRNGSFTAAYGKRIGKYTIDKNEIIIV